MQYKKDIHNIHDKSYKNLYSNKIVFLDLVKNMMKVKWSEGLNTENIDLSNKSYILPDFEFKESDIVYKANISNTEIIFYILLEFQSTVDYTMPLRLLFYIDQILMEYYKNMKFTDKRSLNKNFRIPAVVPIVLYNGQKKWDVPLEFKKIVSYNEMFNNNIINFEYVFLDINHDYSKEELIKNNNMTSAIFLLDQKVDVKEFYERVKDIVFYFDSLSSREKDILKGWLKNTLKEDLSEKVLEILSTDKEGAQKMVFANAFVLDEEREKYKKEGIKLGKKEGIELGKKEGIELGKKEGIELGKKEGIELGIKEGIQKEKEELALKLLDILDDNIISEKVGLDIEIIRKMRMER